MVMNNDDNITPIELLNLYLSGVRTKYKTISKIYQQFNRDLTWETLLNANYQMDLAPILYSLITKKTNIVSKIDPEIICQLKEIRLEYLLNYMVQSQELDTLINAFENEGIDVIQLKGAWIAKRFYPEPSLRPMGDIDLLVRKEYMYKAKECLVKLGYKFVEQYDEESYEEHHFHFPYIKSTGFRQVIVELHYDIKAPSDFMQSNIDEFWETAIPADNKYKHVFALQNEYLLLHLFWHTYLNIANSSGFRIIWLLDILFVIRNSKCIIDWALINKLAKKWKIEKRVYFTLLLICHLFDARTEIEMVDITNISRHSIKVFYYVMRRYPNSLRCNNETKLISRFLLILISLNSISEKKRILSSEQNKRLRSKKERIKKEYNLSSNKFIHIFLFLKPLHTLVKMLAGAITFCIKPIYQKERL